MEPIIHFSEKMIWSQCNNTVNIWFCPEGNVLETSYVRKMFKNQPFFIFHPQVTLEKGICLAMNFDYDEPNLSLIEELIRTSNNNGDVLGSIAKYCTFFLQPYGDFTVNFIR